MTAEQFRVLSKREQEDILINNISSVSFRITETHKVILQKLDDFYVETYFTYPEVNGIDKIIAIDKMIELEPFLFKRVPKDSWKVFRDFLKYNDLDLV